MGMGRDGLLRGLSSFEARAIALILLLLLVFPNVSLASSEKPYKVVVEITGDNYGVRGQTLNLTALVSGDDTPVNLTWILPHGFISEREELVEDKCLSLPCNRTLVVRINESVGVGNQTVGVEAEYD